MVYFDDYETTIASESRTKFSQSILYPDHGIFQCVNCIDCNHDRTDHDTRDETLEVDGSKTTLSLNLNKKKIHEEHSPKILSEELVCRHSEEEEDYNCFDGTLSELSQSCSETDYSNYENGDCDGCSEVQSITLNSYSPVETNLLQHLPTKQSNRPNFASLLQCIDISTPISTARLSSNDQGFRNEKVQKSINNSRNKENTGHDLSDVERYYNMKLKFSPDVQRLQSLNTFATRLFPHDQNIHMSHKETPQKRKKKIKCPDTFKQEMNWELSHDGQIQNCWEFTTNLGHTQKMKQNAQTMLKCMPLLDKRGHQDLKAKKHHRHRELQYGLYEI